MTVRELIECLEMLPDHTKGFEVVFDHTMPEDSGFRLEVVQAIDEITTSDGMQLIILNMNGNEKWGDEDDEKDEDILL
jgi:hypothetical protein